MRLVKIAAAAVLLAGTPALAEGPKPSTTPSKPQSGDVNAQYFPDNTHIPFFTPDAIPWTGQAGKEQQYMIYGDTRKPGPYAMLLKWYPGAFSKPHFHDRPRYIVVIAGTWWVSSSNKYDPSKTYPLKPGSVVSDEVNTVHWDGAKTEPVVLMIVGDGPVSNINVDETGKAIPR
jgi:quercetin dioxygenase-like cupin family protein